MARIQKKEMIAAIAEKAGISQKEATAVVNATFEYLTAQMSAGNEVPVNGFGTFGSKMRNERTGMNPQTKEQVIIPAQKVPFFKASSVLKTTIASGE